MKLIYEYIQKDSNKNLTKETIIENIKKDLNLNVTLYSY